MSALENIDWLGSIIIFVLIWWVVLFMVLPHGATSYHEAGEETEAGNAPSAPMAPRLKRKVLITTVVTFVVWAAYIGLVETGVVQFDMFHHMGS
ncbi:MAG: DUF1467 family protein [Sphingomonadales bacterium]|jgi:predicted secreted protein